MEAGTAGFGGLGRRLRLGMIGGGAGSFIGPTHRMAARLDDRYELVAGALSSDAEKGRQSAVELGIDPNRAYADYAAMAVAEPARDDGVEVVAIVTPNHLHYGPICALLEAGIDIVCDKPLTTDLDEALDLVKRVRGTGRVFALTHAYVAYPLVRYARDIVAAGDLGEIRMVQVEYPQESYVDLSEEHEVTVPRAWRRDPARSGPGGCVADIGTHAHHLAAFVSGLDLAELCADVSTFVPGGRVDDNNNVLLRYDGGARGILWASKIAAGYRNPLRLRLFGTKGGLSWCQEDPNQLEILTARGEPRVVCAGSPDLGPDAESGTRLKPGHPEGLIEAFANIYTDVADVVTARILDKPESPAVRNIPTVEDGARGIKFVDAVLESSAAGGVWMDASLSL
jgi:predicted dehydrogenase